MEDGFLVLTLSIYIRKTKIRYSRETYLNLCNNESEQNRESTDGMSRKDKASSGKLVN